VSTALIAAGADPSSILSRLIADNDALLHHIDFDSPVLQIDVPDNDGVYAMQHAADARNWRICLQLITSQGFERLTSYLKVHHLAALWGPLSESESTDGHLLAFTTQGDGVIGTAIEGADWKPSLFLFVTENIKTVKEMQYTEALSDALRACDNRTALFCLTRFDKDLVEWGPLIVNASRSLTTEMWDLLFSHLEPHHLFQQAENGMTVLHAVCNGATRESISLARRLLEYLKTKMDSSNVLFREWLDTPDEVNQTALSYARKWGQYEVVGLLLEHGAEAEDELEAEAEDESGAYDDELFLKNALSSLK
jgi:ankyrin repeat protein